MNRFITKDPSIKVSPDISQIVATNPEHATPAESIGDRFSKLRSKAINFVVPQHLKPNSPSDTAELISFGIPDSIVPSNVAMRFPETASYFPSTLRSSEEIALSAEEAMRFDVLAARRSCLQKFDAERHDAAVTRRQKLLAERKQLQAHLRRHWSEPQKEADGSESEVSFAPEGASPWLKSNPFRRRQRTSINPSAIAAHFPRMSKLFDPPTDKDISLESEMATRFDALANRRKLQAPIEQARFMEAAERRMLILCERQLEQHRAGLLRSTRLAVLKVRQNTIEAGFWAIPTEIHPAYVATMFHRNSAKFADHYLYTEDPAYAIALEDEEQSRFVPLFDRRVDRRYRDEERHVAAFFRRDAIIKERVNKQKAADRYRKQRVARLKRRNEHFATLELSQPETVNPAEVASHFPHTTRRFGVASYPLIVDQMKHRLVPISGFDEYSTMPLGQEEMVRFNSLMVSREVKAAAEHDRCLKAEANRTAIISGIRRRQKIADGQRKRKRDAAISKKDLKKSISMGTNQPKPLESSAIMDAFHAIESKVSTPLANITGAVRSMIGAGNATTKSTPPSTPSAGLHALAERAAAAQASISASSTLGNSARKRSYTGTRMSFSSNPSMPSEFMSTRAIHEEQPLDDRPLTGRTNKVFYYEEAFIPSSARMAEIEKHFPSAAAALERSSGVFNVRTQSAELTRKDEESHRFDRLWKRRALMNDKDHQRLSTCEANACERLKEKKAKVSAQNARWLEKSQEMRAAPSIHFAKWAKYDQMMQTEAAKRRADILESRVWQQQQDGKRRREKYMENFDPVTLKKVAKVKTAVVNDRISKGCKRRQEFLNSRVAKLRRHNSDVSQQAMEARNAREDMEREISVALKKSMSGAPKDDKAGLFRASQSIRAQTSLGRDDMNQVLDVMDRYDDRFSEIERDEAKERKALHAVEHQLASDMLTALSVSMDWIKVEERSRGNLSLFKKENEVLTREASVEKSLEDARAELEQSEHKARIKLLKCPESVAFKHILRQEDTELHAMLDDSNGKSTPMMAEEDMSGSMHNHDGQQSPDGSPRITPQLQHPAQIISQGIPATSSASSFRTSDRDLCDNLSPTAQVHPHTLHPSEMYLKHGSKVVSIRNPMSDNIPDSPPRAFYYSNQMNESISEQQADDQLTYSSTMSGSYTAAKNDIYGKPKDAVSVKSLFNERRAARKE